MKSSNWKKLPKRGSSLVITLLVITLLAIILVAFMQTATMARTSSKSYSDLRQASMAADAGLDIAVSQIITAIGTNRAFVTGQTNYPNANFPLLVIGQKDLTNSSQLMPLVSGPTNFLAGYGNAGWEASFAAYAGARANLDPTQSVDINTDKRFIQQTADTNLYRASWVVMTNVMGSQTNYARYAFVIVDDDARLNPTLNNGTGAGYTNAANWYSGPQDIALTNTAPPLLTSEQAQKVNQYPQSFSYTDTTLGQIFTNRPAYEAVKHLLTSQTNANFDIIPAGLADAGRLKYNINDLATNNMYGGTAEDRAKNIASIIGRNLTNFYKRDPAFRDTNSTTYLNRLAANIVDYIDGDSSFTSVNGEASGQEVSVFPTMIAERIRAISGGVDTGAPHTKARVSTQTFVSVWNPYDKSITITNSQLRVWNRTPYTFGSAPAMTPPEYNYTITPANLIARPNEFVVLTFPTQALPEMVSPVAVDEGPVPQWTSNWKFLQYELKINGEVVAKSAGVDGSGVADGGGMTQSGLAVFNQTNQWQINRLLIDATQVSDPRFSSLYRTVWNNTKIADHYPTATYWKGRSGGGGKANQNYNSLWQTRDHTPRNSTVGTRPEFESVTPDTLASTYQVSDGVSAPGLIRNGPMLSIGELGNIYDPSHAQNSLEANTYMDVEWNYSSPYAGGGARTLRIGQPESQGNGENTWDVDGRRATEFLDVFSVNSTNSGTVGRINLNTAPIEVLANTLSGIKLTSDAGMAGGVRTFSNPTNIANAVITNRPYSKLSDIYKVLPAFNSTTNYAPALTLNAVSQLNTFDRTREEAFGRWIQHVTVQSQTYRIYVIGQVLDQKQNPRADVAIEARVYLEFDETSNSFRPRVQYVRTLK